jgi:hypothetical protein
MAAAMVLPACGRPSDESSIRVTVADDQDPRDHVAPGDPLGGGTTRLHQQDTVVLEDLLDQDRWATVSLPGGDYTVQVFRESDDLGCFWGNTLYDVQLPQAHIDIAVFQICSGS